MARKTIIRKTNPEFPEVGKPGGALGKLAAAIRDTGGFLKPMKQKRLYKTGVVRRVAKDSRLSQRVVSDALNRALGQITSALARNESVSFPGFGTFYTRMRVASTARSFATGKPVAVPPMRVAGFRVGELLKQAVRKGKKTR